MFSAILGYFWILMGLFFFVRPQFLKNIMQKKTIKKMRGVLFALALALSGLFINIGWKLPGILAKIVLIFGVLGVFKAFFILQGKMMDKVIEWMGARPLGFFRLAAVFHIGFGAILVLMK